MRTATASILNTVWKFNWRISVVCFTVKQSIASWLFVAHTVQVQWVGNRLKILAFSFKHVCAWGTWISTETHFQNQGRSWALHQGLYTSKLLRGSPWQIPKERKRQDCQFELYSTCMQEIDNEKKHDENFHDKWTKAHYNLLYLPSKVWCLYCF